MWYSNGRKSAALPVDVALGKSSYGTSTICDLIPFEFGGTVDLTHAPEGVRCRVELPGDWISTSGDEAMSRGGDAVIE